MDEAPDLPNFSLVRRGILCVISGSAGSGKTTLCHAMRDEEGCYHTVSCTTREPRGGEENGIAYHFLSEDEFVARIDRGEFLEHAQVFGKRYGTLKSEVLDRLERGQDVIMDIDVQGAAQIRACEDEALRKSLVDVFILVPEDELKARLTSRATETPEQLATRLGEAMKETVHWRRYQYAIKSGNREEDREVLRAILIAERHRAARLWQLCVDESKPND